MDSFDYTFDSLADVVDKFTAKVGLKKYTLYVQDYGAPVGYRLAVKHPERVTGLVVQNGNAYDEGIDNDFWKPVKTYWKDRTEENARPLREFFKLAATKWQYTDGVRNLEAISPDSWTFDQAFLDRPGNNDIQWRSCTATGAIRHAIPRGRPTSASINRRHSLCGARMTRFSQPRVRTLTNGT